MTFKDQEYSGRYSNHHEFSPSILASSRTGTKLSLTSEMQQSNPRVIITDSEKIEGH